MKWQSSMGVGRGGKGVYLSIEPVLEFSEFGVLCAIHVELDPLVEIPELFFGGEDSFSLPGAEVVLVLVIVAGEGLAAEFLGQFPIVY